MFDEQLKNSWKIFYLFGSFFENFQKVAPGKKKRIEKIRLGGCSWKVNNK